MKFLILLAFSLLVASAEQEQCSSECPQDCGMTGVDGNGCVLCDCSENPFAELPPPPSPPSKRDVSEDEPPMNDGDLCRKTCPQDCGCMVENGTATCHCTAENHPLIRTAPPTPPAPTTPAHLPSKRDVKEDETTESDGDLCRKKCPQDCGCLVENGTATCHCTAENHPLIRPETPMPPAPPPPSKRDVKESDGDLCRKKCPQDCGCLVNDGVATCRCTAENHPLIRPATPMPPRAPPPPPPGKRDVKESDGDLCRKKCPQDCGCLVNDGVATCRCTAENHPLIRPTPPRPKCSKALPTCEAPCKLEFVDNKICPECKCD